MKEKINCVAALIMVLSIAATLSSLMMRGVYAIILFAGNEKINPSLDMTWMIASYCALGVSIVSGIVTMNTNKNFTITTPTKKHTEHRAEEIEKISKALDDAQKVEALTKELEALADVHNSELEEKNKELEVVKAERDKLKEALVKLEEEWEGERVKVFFFNTPERRQEVEDWFAANPNIEISRPPLQTSSGNREHLRTHLTVFYKKKPKPVPFQMDMATV